MVKNYRSLSCLPEPVLPGLAYSAEEPPKTASPVCATLGDLFAMVRRWPVTSTNEMPRVAAYNGPLPSSLHGYGRFQGRLPAHHAMHFFLDDAKIAGLLSYPERGLSRVRSLCGLCLGPDLSIRADMPLAEKLCRSLCLKALTRWWQLRGLRVIPTVVWADPDSLGALLEGYPAHSVIAVGSRSLGRDRRARRNFLAGCEMVRRLLEPTAIVRYGRPVPGESTDGCVFYEPDTFAVRA